MYSSEKKKLNNRLIIEKNKTAEFRKELLHPSRVLKPARALNHTYQARRCDVQREHVTSRVIAQRNAKGKQMMCERVSLHQREIIKCCTPQCMRCGSFVTVFIITYGSESFLE